MPSSTVLSLLVATLAAAQNTTQQYDYDYLVSGAGTASMLLAVLLSEENLLKTLGTNAPMSSIIMASDLTWNVPFEHFYESVFTRTCAGEHLTAGNLMLPRNAGGVPDTCLRLYGIENHRVVHGPIFLYQPTARPIPLLL